MKMGLVDEIGNEADSGNEEKLRDRVRNEYELAKIA